MMPEKIARGSPELNHVDVLAYDYRSILDVYTTFGEDLSAISASDMKENLAVQYGEKTGEVIGDLQTFVLTVAKNTGKYADLQIDEDVLGFTGKDKNGIDEDYGPRTHAALLTIRQHIGLEGITSILHKGKNENNLETPIEIEAVPGNKEQQGEVEKKLSKIEKEIEALNIRQKGEEAKKLQERKEEIEADIAQKTIVERVYTKNKITGYTKLVIEKTHTDYTQALQEIHKVDTVLGKKIEEKAAAIYRDFEDTEEGKERIAKLETEGNMTRGEAEDILRKQIEIEALHYYVQEADISITSLVAVQHFEKMYEWYNTSFGNNVYTEGRIDITQYTDADLVKDMEKSINTNESLHDFIQTGGDFSFEEASVGAIRAMSAQQREMWYTALAERGIPASKMPKDQKNITDEEIDMLFPFSQDLQKALETYTSQQAHTMALIGNTYYIQQLFSGTAGIREPLYREDTIDFSFDDMQVIQGSVRNSFAYQGRSLTYTIAANGDIHIEPTGMMALAGFFAGTGMHIDGPGIEEIVDHMKGISRNYQNILEHGAEEYIQGTLTRAMKEVVMSHPVDDEQQAYLRRDVEFYTFAEHLYFGNEMPKHTGAKIVGGDDIDNMQLFLSQCYQGTDESTLSVEDFSHANLLLSNQFFLDFVQTLDVSLWDFLSDAGLVGQGSAGFSSPEQFRTGWKLLENLVVYSTQSTLTKRKDDMAVFTSLYGKEDIGKTSFVETYFPE